jgi:hypothetical protein
MSSSSLPAVPGAVPESTAGGVLASERSADEGPAANGVLLEPAGSGPDREEERLADGLDPDVAIIWRVARLVLEAAAGSASAVNGGLTGMPPTRRVAMDLVIGGGAVAGDVVGRVAGRLTAAGRSFAGTVSRLPLVKGAFGRPRALSLLAERGRRERAAANADLRRLIAALVPAVTSAVLDRLDLTALIRERVALDMIVAQVDVDAVAARVDVDAIARRVDLDAIVDRLDLVDLTNQVIDGIDLPEIIRQSTGSISSGMVRGVRMQGIEADQAVSGLVGRLFHRQPRESEADTLPGPAAIAGQEAPS